MSLRPLALAAFAVMLATPAFAQTPTITDPGAPLSGYPRKALGLPTPAELTTATYIRDVIYGHRDGMALTYDVFKPVSGANGALVVNMVSAGWRSSWGPPEERQARYQWLIDKGFTVVALHHASAPRFPLTDAVQDVRLGMRHIKRHAADYGADPERIGVWGASAGGHLSLVAGLMADDGDATASDPLERSGNRVRAVVAYFPPTDLDVLLASRTRQGAIDFDESLRRGVSPVHFADPRDPPVLLITGDADKGVPMAQSEAMKAALDRAGVENSLVAFPGADHDFYVKGDPAKTDAYANEAMNMMVAWFEQRLR
jgi:acetyl esterase/lipase